MHLLDAQSATHCKVKLAGGGGGGGMKKRGEVKEGRGREKKGGGKEGGRKKTHSHTYRPIIIDLLRQVT